MFTGLIEELGSVKKIKKSASSAIINIENQLATKVKIGDSVAVNGVCLTVVNKGENFFEAEVMKETLEKTNLKDLRQGNYVNLERAMEMGGRLDGHIVNGHVDGMGIIKSIDKQEIADVFYISTENDILKFLVPKGSIAIDGISLTLITIDQQFFSVSLIPHTRKVTTLGIKGVGDTVNLEVDILSKYVFRYMDIFNANKKNGLTKEMLIEKGFI